MAFNPYQPVGTGVSDSSQINGPVTGLNTLLSGLFQSAAAACNSILGVGASAADISGCSVTVNPVGSNAFVVVSGVFDVLAIVSTGNNVFIGLLAVDGVDQSAEAHCDDRQDRMTCGQTWVVPLAAGSHTLKLQAKRAAGTFNVQIQHTTITALLFDIP